MDESPRLAITRQQRGQKTHGPAEQGGTFFMRIRKPGIFYLLFYIFYLTGNGLSGRLADSFSNRKLKIENKK
jgi:hypothetical protein